MSSIDDRIVQLELRDSEFAKKLESDEKALKKFDDALGSVGNSGIASNLQKITDKFSNLGLVGVTALQNITNKAIDAGEQMVKSLTVDNISAGWKKLQSQTKAVGTLSIQGYDTNEVNDVIKQLMWYSDETSYNFEDMLTSMTRFTAQGYGLKEAMETLEGIANWSAVAGQNAAAGSSAMTALSKAVGRGYIMQQDWGSLQTLMMDNKQVRQMILDTAVELGTLEKTGQGTYRSLSDAMVSSLGATEFDINKFATYLTTGKWFTSDVLVETMKKYSEAVKPVYDYVEEHGVSAAEAIKALNGQLSDQALSFFSAAQEARSLEDALESIRVGSASTWQKTFNIIFGDYDRQKEIWTDLSGYLYDLFVESGNSRNELLQEWADQGGSDKLIEGFYNIMEAIISFRDAIRDAWQTIFPPKTASDLVSLTDKFKGFTEKLILSEEGAAKVKKAFEGVFSLFRLGKDIISALISPIASLLGSSNGLGDSLLTLAASIGEAIKKFVEWVESSKALSVVQQIVGAIASVIIDVVKIISEVAQIGLHGFGSISEAAGRIGERLSGLTKIGKNVIGTIMDAAGGIGDKLSGLTKIGKDVFGGLSDTVSGMGDKISEGFKKAKSAIDDFFGNTKKVEEGTSIIVNVSKSYSSAVNNFDDPVVDGVPTKIQKISAAFSTLGTTISGAYNTYLKPVFSGIIGFFKTNIFNSGLVSGLVKIAGIFIGFKALTGVLDFMFAIPTAIADLITGLTSVFGILSGLSKNLKATALLKVAAAIALITASMYVLTTKLDFSDVQRGMDFFVDSLSRIGDAFSKFSFWSAVAIKIISSINVWPVILGLIAFAAAIWAAGHAFEALDKLDPLFSKIFNKKNWDTFLEELTNFAVAFDLLSGGVLMNAIAKFVTDMKKLKKTVYDFTLVKITNNNTDTSWQAGVLKLAAAFALVAAGISVLAKINVEDLKKAGLAIVQIAAVLLIFDLVGVLISKLGYIKVKTDEGKVKKLTDTGKTLLQLATALGIVSLAVALLSRINVEDLKKAGITLAVIGGVIALVGLFSNAEELKHMGSAFKGMGMAMIEIAVGAVILAGALKLLSMVAEDMKKTETTLTTLGTLFGFIVVSAAALALVEGFGKSAAQVAMAGLAMVGIATACLILAGAMAILSTIDVESIKASGLSLAAVMLSIGVSMLMIEKSAKNIGSIIVSAIALGVITAAVIALSFAFKDLQNVDFWTLIGQAVALSGTLIVMAGALAFLNTMKIKLSKVGSSLVAIAALAGVMYILCEAFSQLGDVDWKQIAAAGVVMVAIAGALVLLGVVVGAFKSSIIGIAVIVAALSALGYVTSITIGPIVDAIIRLGDAIAIKGPLVAMGIRTMADSVADSILKICTSIAKGIATIVAWPILLVEMIVDAGKSILGASTSLGGFMSQGIGKGMASKQGLEYVTTGAQGILGAIQGTLEVNSPSKKGEYYGKMMDLGVAQGMATGTDPIKKVTGAIISSVGTAYADGGNMSAIAFSEELGGVSTEDFKNKLDDTLSEVKTNISNAGNEAGQAMGDGLVAGFDASGAADKIINLCKNIGLTIKNVVEKLSTDLAYKVNEWQTGWSREDLEANEALMKWEAENGKTNDLWFEYNKLMRESKDAKGITVDVSKTFGGPGKINTEEDPDDKIEDVISSVESIFDKFTDGLDFADTSMLDDIVPVYSDESYKDYEQYLKDNPLTVGVNGDYSSLTSEIEQMVRKHHELYESDNEWQRWTYSGPLEETIDEGVEWVYEGPTEGMYNKEEDKFYATVGGEMVDLATWTNEYTDLYNSNSAQIISGITSIDQNVTSSIQEQTDQEAKYNSDVLSTLESLGIKIDNLDSSVTGLDDAFSNLGVYLDSGALVGAISDRMDYSLGNKQKLVSQGVLR